MIYLKMRTIHKAEIQAHVSKFYTLEHSVKCELFN